MTTRLHHLALAVLLLGCPPGSSSSTGTSTGAVATCSLPACPAGAFSDCEPGDIEVACCGGTGPSQVCGRPAGVLVHSPACAAVCASKMCAVAPDDGGTTCCAAFDADGGAGPCDL